MLRQRPDAGCEEPPGGGDRVEQCPGGPGGKDEPGPEEQQSGQRVNAIEVDPQDRFRRRSVPEVERRLGEETGKRPRELEHADGEHALLRERPRPLGGGVEGMSKRLGHDLT